MPNYGIDTPLRKAHFLAQVAHESGGFKFVVENLNYSASVLYNVFRKYFPNLDIANEYTRQQEKIANKVYANRMGNGNEASGEGWKFKGRGLIQLTGKNNFQQLSEASGQNFIDTPEKVSEPKWALTSACWFWKKNNINKYADQDDVHMVTKRINGGYNGLQDRQHYLEEFKKIYNI
ncbi:MAG: putative chitinase [Polaribacter sp.]